MIDPNKHGVFNKGKQLKPNWGMLLVLILGCYIWYNIFVHGLFLTLVWIVIGSAIIGIVLKLMEERW